MGSSHQSSGTQASSVFRRSRLSELGSSRQLEAGELDKHDLGGATATFSNLGGQPVDFFVPVISGPQVALIATGRLTEKPIAADGKLTVGHRLWVNVAIDHRGADGAAGGEFLAALERRLAELPSQL